VQLGQSVPLISFVVGDTITPPGSLVVTASSSNTNLVPNTAAALLVLQGSGNPANRSLLVTPNPNTTGSSTITVTVANNAHKTTTATFNLTISRVTVANDFNSDGVPDILFQDNSGFLAAWLMSGDVASQTSFLTPNNVGDLGWRLVDTGDFNADGKPDVVFQHTDGSVAVWMMDGLNLVSSAFTNPSNQGSPDWHAVAVADFNKDGNPDILFQNTNGDLAVWFMVGLNVNSVVPLKPGNPGDLGWKAVAVGDLNGDGNVDVVFQHTDGSLGVWYLINGTTALLIGPLDPPTTATSTGDASWRVVGSSDLNGDGKPDLLLQNRTTGDVAVWYMNGPKLILGKLLTPSNPGGTWQIVAP
jgi:hypothetical protein